MSEEYEALEKERDGLRAELIQYHSVREILKRHGCTSDDNVVHIPTLVENFLLGLESENAALRKRAATAESEAIEIGYQVADLREGLRKLEWNNDGNFVVTAVCPACGGHRDKGNPEFEKYCPAGHKPDCWLAKLLKGKSTGLQWQSGKPPIC